MIPIFAKFRFVSIIAAVAGAAHAAEFTVKEHEHQIDVQIDGQPFTSYLPEGYSKPILYPILGPEGIPITRNWPMKKDVPGEAKDHVHHKSMWFTHGKVNGVDFWTEGPKTGRIVQTKLVRAEGGKDRAAIEATHDWQDAGGKVVMSDTLLLAFSLVPGGRVIDWQIELHASHGPVTFGDTKEGTMAIRTRPELQLVNDPTQGVTTANGQALNSEGVRASRCGPNARIGWTIGPTSTARRSAWRFSTIPRTCASHVVARPRVWPDLRQSVRHPRLRTGPAGRGGEFHAARGEKRYVPLSLYLPRG